MFNSKGVVISPAFIKARPAQNGHPQIEFTVHGHQLRPGAWIAEATWHYAAGDLFSDGCMPHKGSTVFKTLSEAVEAAFSRGMRQVHAQLGTGHKEAVALRQWMKQAIDEVRNHDDDLPLRFMKVIDLGAGGIGGLALGLKSLGAQVVLACEQDPSARNLYMHNINPLQMCSDISLLDGKELHCDILTLSLIGKGFSKAGKQQGFRDAESSNYYQACLKLISEIDAQAVVIETVSGILKRGLSQDAEMLRQALFAANYRVQEHTLNAKGFGLAQDCKRVIVVATRNSMDLGILQGYKFPRGAEPSSSVVDVLDHDIKPKSSPFGGYVHMLALKRRRFLFYVDNKKHQGYRVYDPNGLSPTLVANGGGLSPAGLYRINGSVRTLSSREAMRLQGAPEWLEHHAQPRKALQHASRSIAVPVAREVGRNLAELLYVQAKPVSSAQYQQELHALEERLELEQVTLPGCTKPSPRAVKRL
jgi:site-specific DNA-cytosine methylase